MSSFQLTLLSLSPERVSRQSQERSMSVRSRGHALPSQAPKSSARENRSLVTGEVAVASHSRSAALAQRAVIAMRSSSRVSARSADQSVADDCADVA